MRPTLGEPSPTRRTFKRRDDHDVLAACLEGDQVAWGELVTRYSRLVYSIPHRYGVDRDGCEDVFQEVFAIFVRQSHGIRRRSGLPKWFITTTHRVCRQWFKQSNQALTDCDELIERPSPPADLLQRWERQHVVRLALRRLGGRCEELIVALYTDQGPARYDEIARKLDMPEGSVGPTRARCLAKLMALLNEIEQQE